MTDKIPQEESDTNKWRMYRPCPEGLSTATTAVGFDTHGLLPMATWRTARHDCYMRALKLLVALAPAALALVECGTSPSSATTTPDASTLDVPLVHLFDDDYGQLLYAQAIDGDVFSGEHLDHPEPALSRALSISAGNAINFGIMGSPPESWECAALPTGQLVCEGSAVDGTLGAIANDSCYNICGSFGGTPNRNLPKQCDAANCFTLFAPACYACVMDWTPLPTVTNLRQIHRGCGVDYAGNVTCWAGHVGNFPRPVRALEGNFAILDNGDLYPADGGSTPILQSVVQATSDDLGSASECAVTGDGSLYCWGDNDYGQVGDGTMTPRQAPVLVGTGYRHVRTSRSQTCAVRTDNTVACWGDVEPKSGADCGYQEHCAASPVSVAGLANVKEIGGLRSMFDALLMDGSIVSVEWPPESPTIKTIHTAQ
jgi:hypothetical protein